MRLSITLLAMTAALTLSAQADKASKAEKKFERYSYDIAADELERIERKSLDDKRKLAYSYLRTGELAAAERYFSNIVASADKLPSDVLTYAEVLKKNKKYAAAQQQMSEYASMSPADTRGQMHVNKPGYETALMKDAGQFTIKNLAINTAQEDFGPAYYKDAIVFASSRQGASPVKRQWNWNRLPFLDMYQGDPNGDLELSGIKPHYKKFNKKYHEGPTAFSADGSIKVFTRNNYTGTDKDGVRRLKMFEARAEDEDWSAPVGMPWNSDEYSAGHATLSADGNTMYFASDKPGGQGGVDIYMSKRNGDKWGVPVNAGAEVNTEGNEMFPFLHGEGYLIFASDGHLGLGGLDLFYSEIDEQGNLSAPANIGVPINSNLDDFAMILDKEMTSGYFSSNREGGKGDDDIYSFKMLKPFESGIIIEGIAMDKSGLPLPGAMVSLYDSKGNEIESVPAAEDGSYSFSVDPEMDYALSGTLEDYFDGMNTATTKGATDVVNADVVLEKDPGLSLYGLITQTGTDDPLAGVKVTLSDNLSDEVETFTTPMSGDFRDALTTKKINDRISYNVTLEKEGYLTKRVTYNKLIDRPGQYDMHGNMDLSLTKLEVGMDIGKAININPIYFDINKYNIRPDAQVELQKIVDVMKEYPTMEIELGSHTDCRASEEYNRSLSDRRAKASAEWVRSRIPNGERIFGKGYGESQLVNHCACDRTDRNNQICSEEEHQLNRRTEFRIIKM